MAFEGQQKPSCVALEAILNLISCNITVNILACSEDEINGFLCIQFGCYQYTKRKKRGKNLKQKGKLMQFLGD